MIRGRVIEVVKGGLTPDIGQRGLLPVSLVEKRRVRDLQPYVGRELEVKIIEVDKSRNKVVLSRRAWLEQASRETDVPSSQPDIRLLAPSLGREELKPRVRATPDVVYTCRFCRNVFGEDP